MPAAVRSIALFLLLAHGAAGQKTVEVHCLGPGGEPVAGAEVWVFQLRKAPGDPGRWLAFGPFATDGVGAAACPEVVTYAGGAFDRLVWARLHGRLVGMGAASGAPGGGPARPILLTLRPAHPVIGRVLAPDGSVPPGARVEVIEVGLGVEDPLRLVRHGGAPPGLEDVLADGFETRADKDGRFLLRDLPAGGEVVLLARAPRNGLAELGVVVVPDGREVALNLPPESVLSGTLKDKNGRKLGDVPLEVTMTRQSSWRTRETWTTRTDEAGRFHVAALPAAEVAVTVSAPREAGLFMPVRVRLSAGEERVLNASLESGVRVVGSVRDRDHDKPVHGVLVRALPLGDYGGAPLAECRTAEDGSFALQLPDGWITVRVEEVPRAYSRGPRPGRDLRIRSEKGVEPIHFELRR